MNFISDETAYVGIVLDPRVKTVTSDIKNDVEKAKTILTILLGMLRHKQEQIGYIVEQSRNDEDEDLFSPPQNSKRMAQTYVEELNMYEAEIPRPQSIDPLDWWKINESRYPILAALAKDIFTIQASSVPCEQLFSSAGRTHTEYRASLTDETVEALVSLKS
ncbi:hypothetical protein P9112_009369 [Eukaryota sp. TZLM1-RC]